ncbi:MAG: hypothetical protein PWP64_528 [Candidatus Cloacimonadota bacterium]|nr:hypothetical protein [Candidatus Cloacimonadota bacterium]
MKLQFIVLLFLLFAGSMLYAEDPWGEPVTYPGSMIVMAQVSINGSPAAQGDVLGAFVALEGNYILRGKANVLVIDGVSGCLLQIYCANNGELIHFRVWDDDTLTQYDSEENILTEIDGELGSYPDNLFPINGINPQDIVDPWGTVQALSEQMQLAARVLIDDTDAEMDDILAAVVEIGGTEQLRGKVPIQLINGMAFCDLIIYSEDIGEEIQFKIWDYSEQMIKLTDQMLLSDPGTNIGFLPEDSYLINFGGDIDQIPSPQIDPPGGIYDQETLVSINCDQPDAQIYYTFDGSLPDETSFLYIEPFNLPAQSTVTIKARAFLDNNQWLPSLISSAVFEAQMQVASPQISPAGGNFNDPQMVSISCTTLNAQIRYTTDGSEPDENSPLYNESFTLFSDCTLKAKAFLQDWIPSVTTSADFTFSLQVSTPVFTPASGFYNNPIVMQIICTTDQAQIYYTLDGSTPDMLSNLYTEAMLISENTLVKAKAFYQDWIPSEEAQAQYSFPTDNTDPHQSPFTPGIKAIYPNPSHGKLSFLLQTGKSPEPYILQIFNLKGQCVYSMTGTVTGELKLDWDPRELSGKGLSPGLYLAKLSIKNTRSVKKIILY